MARSAALVDEVWVYSRHAADAIEAGVRRTGARVRAAGRRARRRSAVIDRAAVGFTDDFTFLFCFDFASVFERKNPLAVVNAFRRAFAPGDGPRLLIKSVNGGASPLAWARLEAATADRPDIEIRDGYETRRTPAGVDGRVRLLRVAAPRRGLRPHDGRGDGGRPPGDRTAYSGNLEFMTPETSVLIPYELVPHAVRVRAVSADRVVGRARRRGRRRGDARAWPPIRTAAALLGAQARAHIDTHHTAESRVDFVRSRLHDLRSNR